MEVILESADSGWEIFGRRCRGGGQSQSEQQREKTLDQAVRVVSESAGD